MVDRENKEDQLMSERDRHHLAECLNKLEILIHKGEVQLDSDDVNTDDEAVLDAFKEIMQEKQEAELREKARLTGRNPNEVEDYMYEIDSDEFGEGEEEESDIFGPSESTPADDDTSTHRQSTVKSNDIALGFDEEDEESNLGDVDEKDDDSSRNLRRTSEYQVSPSPNIKRSKMSRSEKRRVLFI